MRKFEINRRIPKVLWKIISKQYQSQKTFLKLKKYWKILNNKMYPLSVAEYNIKAISMVPLIWCGI